MGGLHSTGDLVKLIQRKCTISKGMYNPSIIVWQFVSFGFGMVKFSEFPDSNDS